MIKPLYAENIIVGVKYKNKLNWYITESDLWCLDYNQAGYPPSEYPEERKGISILNETTIANFLERIEKYKRFTEDIRLEFLRELRTNREEAYYDYNPCFLIDFERLTFILIIRNQYLLKNTFRITGEVIYSDLMNKYPMNIDTGKIRIKAI